MIPRFILFAIAIAVTCRAGYSQAQTMVVTPQFAGGGVAQIPAVITNPSTGDPYATVAIQSPFQWLGNGPVLGNTGLLGHSGSNLERLWLRAEYLNWWTDGMEVPALVTTSPAGTPRDTAAVLGENGTSVLFGNREMNEGVAGGFRVSSGFWITPQRTFAIEGEYFQLLEQDDAYSASGNGSPIIGRPYFDVAAGQETAQLISFPDRVSGSLAINSETDLRSLLINGRVSLCPTHGACCATCDQQDRTDWIVGYRRLMLEDTLAFHENLESLLPNAPGTIVMNESFDTKNEFNGLQLGVVNVTQLRRAWLESILRVALGNNSQRVRINGSTDITEAGITDTLPGGLLALRTNSGTRERDQFTMIPEIGLKLGIRLTDRAFATIGYSVLYFPNVVRAGDQIDLDVNQNLVPPELDPLTGALRPRFRFIESDYLAHGISLGGEFRF